MELAFNSSDEMASLVDYPNFRFFMTVRETSRSFWAHFYRIFPVLNRPVYATSHALMSGRTVFIGWLLVLAIRSGVVLDSRLQALDYDGEAPLFDLRPDPSE